MANFPNFTVFIVDDDEAICEAICNLLESVGAHGERFFSAMEFMRSGRIESPGCLVLDFRLPEMTGVEFQEELARIGVSIPIIFMTAHGDIPMVRRVMKAGAIEFLTKPFQKEELLSAVQHAFDKLRTQRRQQEIMHPVKSRYESLTPREREVMALMTDGVLTKQIAGQLQLSEITIKLYRRRVMDKMQASSLANLVRMADALKNPAGS